MSRALFVFSWLGLAAPVVGEESTVDYERDVKPILRERCYACHGTLKQEAGLRLDAGQLIRDGSDSGTVVEPGRPSASVLIERVSAPEEAERMPPEGRPLSAEQIDLLKGWIAEGAEAPADDRPEAAPDKHWAFQPLQRREVPVPTSREWGDHPIDRWIGIEHQRRGLTPLANTSKPTLLRRLFLGLVGRPPLREDLAAFEADDGDYALESLVDRLLARAEYGERWGRHWMDIWRYSDWYGLGPQLRNSQKHLWRWRDWIVESLNRDSGYDRMIVDMLAADEVAPLDSDRLRATGFLARNYYLFNRTTWLDDTIEHTAKAFLGLTMNCTKCHDHKYDPITQLEYYKLRAVFEPHQVRLDPVPGETDLEKDGLPRAFDAHPGAPTYVHIRGNPKELDDSRRIEPGVPAVLGGALKIAPVNLPLAAYRPGLRPHVLRDRLDEARRALKEAEAALAKAEKAHDARSTASKLALVAASATLSAAEYRPTYVSSVHAVEWAQGRGASALELYPLIEAAAEASQEYEVLTATAALATAKAALAEATNHKEEKKKDAKTAVTKAQTRLSAARKAQVAGENDYKPLYASRKALEGPDETEESRRQPYPVASTGRRTALAHWIASADNPLTARVAVNHIWTRHLGQPLVESVSDFGRRAPRPPLLDLLDWLAIEFIDSGWSMKHLHRLIVTSRVYALRSSVVDAASETLKTDPENRLFWRRRPMRMEAQVVRDSLLFLAGQLQAELGGPSVDPVSEPRRRSLYLLHSRDTHDKFLAMFDDADIFQCYRRTESIVPQQALTLANSKLALATARQTATRLHEDLAHASDAQFVNVAFEHVLSVAPTKPEAEACLEVLEEMRRLLKEAEHAEPQLRARQNLVHALYNHNDFITIR